MDMFADLPRNELFVTLFECICTPPIEMGRGGGTANRRGMYFRYFNKIGERAFAAKCPLQQYEMDVYDLKLCRRGRSRSCCVHAIFEAFKQVERRSPRTRYVYQRFVPIYIKYIGCMVCLCVLCVLCNRM